MKQEYKESLEKQCKKQCELMVDTLFDNQLLNSNLKRIDIRALEDLLLINTYDVIIWHIKAKELLDSIESRKAIKNPL